MLQMLQAVQKRKQLSIIFFPLYLCWLEWKIWKALKNIGQKKSSSCGKHGKYFEIHSIVMYLILANDWICMKTHFFNSLFIYEEAFEIRYCTILGVCIWDSNTQVFTCYIHQFYYLFLRFWNVRAFLHKKQRKGQWHYASFFSFFVLSFLNC